MYFGSQWIDKTAYGRIITESSWRPKSWKWRQLTAVLQFGTHSFWCLKSSTIPQQRQQRTRNGKNWRKFRRGTWRKSEVRKRWSMKQRRRAQKFFSPHWWTCDVFQNCWIGDKSTKNTTVELYFEVILFQTTQELIQYSLNKDHQHQKWQQQKSWTLSPVCQIARDKQRTQYLLIPLSTWRMYSKLLKFPKSECQDIWIRLPRHKKWPKSWSCMEDPVVPLERNLYGHTLAGLSWERQFEKIQLKHGWEKIPNWECFFVNHEKGFFSCVYVDDIKLAGKERNLDPMWKVLNKEVDFGRTNIFHGSWKLWMRSTTMPNKQRYCGQLQNHVWISNFRGESGEITTQNFRIFHGLMRRRVMQRNVWSDIVSKPTSLHNNSTKYVLHASMTTTSMRKNEICWRIVTSMLSNWSEIFILGTNWTTWYSMVIK